MKKTVLCWSVAAALGLPLIAQAAVPAAVVAKIEGNAVATQGERYVTVHDGMRLVEGDRLMVLEGGQAVVTFSDGCRLDLPEMAILSVQASSTCALNDGGTYQVNADSGVAPDTSPKPQLAAIGVKKARSKAECDLAAQNDNPKDDCDCDERRKNDDKDDDNCLAGVAAGAGAGVVGTTATTSGSTTGGTTGLLGGTTMVGGTAVPTAGLIGGGILVAGGITAAAVNSSRSSDRSGPVSP